MSIRVIHPINTQPIRSIASRLSGTDFAEIADSHWWTALSPDQQEQYMLEHPHSKKTKEVLNQRKSEDREAKISQMPNKHLEKPAGHGAQGPTNLTNPKKSALTQPIPGRPDGGGSLLGRMKGLIGKMKPKDQHFFQSGGMKPHSKERRSTGRLLKDKSKGILKHLHSQGKEWAAGAKAVKKLAQRQPLNHHDKEALKGCAQDLVITTLSVAVMGGFGHGIVGLIQHYGMDIVRDSMLKAVAHSAIHASTLPRLLERAEGPTSRFMEETLNGLIEYLESADIPEDKWEAVIQKIASGDQSVVEDFSDSSDDGDTGDDTGEDTVDSGEGSDFEEPEDSDSNAEDEGSDEDPQSVDDSANPNTDSEDEGEDDFSSYDDNEDSDETEDSGSDDSDGSETDEPDDGSSSNQFFDSEDDSENDDLSMEAPDASEEPTAEEDQDSEGGDEFTDTSDDEGDEGSDDEVIEGDDAPSADSDTGDEEQPSADDQTFEQPAQQPSDATEEPAVDPEGQPMPVKDNAPPVEDNAMEQPPSDDVDEESNDEEQQGDAPVYSDQTEKQLQDNQELQEEQDQTQQDQQMVDPNQPDDGVELEDAGEDEGVAVDELEDSEDPEADSEADNGQEVREGKQFGDGERTEDRMFGEHEQENQDSSEQLPSNDMQDVTGPGDATLEQPDNPAEQQQMLQKQTRDPNAQPTDPATLVDPYPQLDPKEAEDLISKDFYAKMGQAQGVDLEHYKQMERIWHRTRDFEANGLKPEELTKDSLMFRGNPLDAHALMRQIKRMGHGKMEVDDGGSMHGVLKIDERQVKVSVHKIGMDGEALISFYPLLEDPLNMPPPLPDSQPQQQPTQQSMEQPAAPEEPAAEEEMEDPGEPDPTDSSDLGDDAFEGDESESDEQDGGDTELSADPDNTEGDDDEVKGNEKLQPTNKLKKMLSETP